MPSMTDDPTTVRALRPDERLVYEKYAMASRPHVASEGDTETRQLTLPIPQLFCRVTELNDTIKQIIAIMNGDEEDEDGKLRPTQHALVQVSRLLMDACNAFLLTKGAAHFPRASVSPDLDGGLRIEWYMAKGVVRLVVPPKQSALPYLFHRIDSDANTDFAVSGSSIAAWLGKAL
jgi:hypothetical protein